MNKYLFFLFLIICFFILSIILKNLIFWIFLIIVFFALIYLNKKYFIIIFLFFPLIISINFVINQNINNSNNHYAIVVKKYNSSYFIKEDKNIYYLMSSENLYVGDEIFFTGKYIKNDNFNSFSIFQLSNKAIYYINASEIKTINKKENTRNNLLNNLEKSKSLYSSYALLLLYNEEDNYNYDILNQINKLGISHLFVISGFHIAMIFTFTGYLIKKVTKNKKIVNLVSNFIAFFFLYLTYFPISGKRAFIYQNIKSSTNLRQNDSMLLTAIVMLILNPFNLFSLSLLLSFSISFLIISINSNKRKGKTNKQISIAFYAFILSIPIVSVWQEEFNLFSFLLTLIISPTIFYLYFLILFFLPFPFFWNFLNPIFISLTTIFYLLTNLYFPIKITIKNTMMHIFWFLLIFIIMINKKKEN